MSKNALRWTAEYADAVFALALALVFGVLGSLDLVSAHVTGGATLGTLAVLTIAVLRDRGNKVALDQEIRKNTDFAREVLGTLPGRLEKIEKIGESVAELRGIVEGTGTVRTLRGQEVGDAL